MSIKPTKLADHAQVPGWDVEVLGGGTPICYEPGDWRAAPASFTEHSLTILGQAVMRTGRSRICVRSPRSQPRVEEPS